MPPKKKPKVQEVVSSEWPLLFYDVQAVFRSLNTIYTFLESRKHVITTFDSLKGTVERDIKRPLTFMDIARIRALMPNETSFDYIDENQVDLCAGEGAALVGKGGYNAKELDIYDGSSARKGKNLLIYEMTDGKLRVGKSGAKTIDNQRDLATESVGRFRKEIRPPTFSLDEVKKLINDRNNRFDRAVNRFLAAFLISASGNDDTSEFHSADAEKSLDALAAHFLPQEKDVIDPVEKMTQDLMFSNAERSSVKDIFTVIDSIFKEDYYSDQVVEGGTFSFPERPAVFGELNKQLHPALQRGLLRYKGIERLYCHQSTALNELENGKNIIVSTSTSSGKSLIYQLPILQELLSEEACESQGFSNTNRYVTAFYIFPTKSLAQDQKRSFLEFSSHIPELEISIDTYDGDTRKDERKYIRESSTIIFTNPDMLHNSILPSWNSWQPFLRSLRYVVVDELHVYEGIFGTHVAYIMRRLLRICRHLGNTNVQVISCSATIRKPLELMKSIFGVEAVLIENDGSPMGTKHLLVWNTPYISHSDHTSGRLSPFSEAAKLMVSLMSQGVRTIAFCKFRKACEQMIKSVRQILADIQDCDLESRIMSYRGGYSVQDRRQIEKQMFDGQLLGIVSTNALELGIDIGNLDAVLIVGFPFSISNFRQQSGRAGRRKNGSLTVFVAGGEPVEQHFAANPKELIDRPVADICLAMDNLLILEAHLQCAALELPISIDEYEYFDKSKEVFERIVSTRLIPSDEGCLYQCHPRFYPRPCEHVFIRGVQEDSFAVVDVTNGRNRVIEETEASRVTFTLYEGGILVHQGYPYLVKEFNPDEKYAKVERVDVDWTTRQRDFVDVDPIETLYLRTLKRLGKNEPSGETTSEVSVFYGNVRNTAIVFGFFKFDKRGRILDAVEVHNPPYIYETKGFWIDIPVSALEAMSTKKLNAAAAIHAAEHAIINLMPTVVTIFERDVGTECKAPEKEFAKRQSNRKRPARLIFYDCKGGVSGSGITTKAFEFVEELIEEALERTVNCPCSYGCPECVASETCKERSVVLSKPGARIILTILAGKELCLDDIPDGPEVNLEGIGDIETVVSVGMPVKGAKRAKEWGGVSGFQGLNSIG